MVSSTHAVGDERKRETVFEHRRYTRALLGVPAEFVEKGGKTRVGGRAKDISLGGMFIETPEPLAFNASLTVYVTLPGEKAPFALPGIVRWTRPDGMGIQFDMLGARETHAITEHTRTQPA
jgi:type IV pilus assembly protein PilZ